MSNPKRSMQEPSGSGFKKYDMNLGTHIINKNYAEFMNLNPGVMKMKSELSSDYTNLKLAVFVKTVYIIQADDEKDVIRNQDGTVLSYKYVNPFDNTEVESKITGRNLSGNQQNYGQCEKWIRIDNGKLAKVFMQDYVKSKSSKPKGEEEKFQKFDVMSTRVHRQLRFENKIELLSDIINKDLLMKIYEGLSELTGTEPKYKIENNQQFDDYIANFRSQCKTITDHLCLDTLAMSNSKYKSGVGNFVYVSQKKAEKAQKEDSKSSSD